MKHLSLKNITEWIYRLMYISSLFVIFSLPVITAGASASACAYLAHQARVGGERPQFSTFFERFKTSFVSATKVWIGILLFGGGVVYNLLGTVPTSALKSILWMIQWPLLFQTAMVVLFTFQVIAIFEVGSMRALKTAWIIANRNLLLSLGIMGSLVAGFEIGRYIPAIHLFILPGMFFLLSDYVLSLALVRIDMDHQVEA